MKERGFRFTGIFLLVAGFALWAYGFVYSSFWYANAGDSIFEPARVRFWETIGRPMLPGLMEEVVGLAGAVMGLYFYR